MRNPNRSRKLMQKDPQRRQHPRRPPQRQVQKGTVRPKAKVTASPRRPRAKQLQLSPTRVTSAVRVPTRAKEKEKAGVRTTRLSLRSLQQQRIRQVHNPAKGQHASFIQKGHVLEEGLPIRACRHAKESCSIKGRPEGACRSRPVGSRVDGRECLPRPFVFCSRFLGHLSPDHRSFQGVRSLCSSILICVARNRASFA